MSDCGIAADLGVGVRGQRGLVLDMRAYACYCKYPRRNAYGQRIEGSKINWDELASLGGCNAYQRPVLAFTLERACPQSCDVA
mgnify:CR=1 FL=1